MVDTPAEGTDLVPGGPAPRRRPSEVLAAPPGPVFYALAITVALGVMWASSLPGASVWGLGLALLGAFFLGLTWFFRMLWAFVLLERRPLRAWAWPPLGGLVLAGLLVVQAPLHARFTLAQGELTDIAKVLSAADRPAIHADDLPIGRRIGSYLISGVDFDGRVVLFRFGDDALVGGGWGGGMAYVPDGVDVPPDRPYTASLRHLRGNWYRWFVDLSD